jgi:hypothetical protein
MAAPPVASAAHHAHRLRLRDGEALGVADEVREDRLVRIMASLAPPHSLHTASIQPTKDSDVIITTDLV